MFQSSILNVYFLHQVMVKNPQFTVLQKHCELWHFCSFALGACTLLSSHSSFWIMLKSYFFVAFSTSPWSFDTYIWLFFLNLSHCIRAIYISGFPMPDCGHWNTKTLYFHFTHCAVICTISIFQIVDPKYWMGKS